MATAVDERKVVWVLGAGFSRALGGPLLPNLLSDESEGNLRVRYPVSTYRRLYDDAAQIARGVFVIGLAGHERRQESLWADAEEFIDYVDTAAGLTLSNPLERVLALTGVDSREPNPHLERMRGLVSRLTVNFNAHLKEIPMSAIRAAARRLVAAECCAFLEAANTGSERWRPFRAWASSLTPNDTIISFNYDRVLERLREVAITEGRPTAIQVIAPNEGDEPSTWRDRAPLFKLHGSVDWQKVPQPEGTSSTEELIVKHEDKRFALTCPDEELALATP